MCVVQTTDNNFCWFCLASTRVVNISTIISQNKSINNHHVIPTCKLCVSKALKK